MDNENYRENYNELISGYFNSSLSNEEEKMLMDWLNKDVANKKYFDECHEVWLASKLKAARKVFNSEEAFHRFEKKIKHTISNEKRLIKRISISLGKAAAVLLIAYLLGALTFSLLHKKSKAVDATNFTITVPAGSKTKMNLPDGTQVWLNSQSKLTYASNYNQTSREVTLEGEGYFKVAHDKKRPFLVNTSKITIRALGTEFNVKCYADEGLIETTLVNGSVKIEEKKSRTKKNTVILKPNEKLIFVKQTGMLYLKSDTLNTANQNQIIHSEKSGVREEAREEKMIIKAIDPTPQIAWKDDKLVFTGENFDEIKAKLERWFGVTIQVRDCEIISYRFKGSFEKETLEQALEALKLAAHFKYSIYKNQVIITK